MCVVITPPARVSSNETNVRKPRAVSSAMASRIDSRCSSSRSRKTSALSSGSIRVKSSAARSAESPRSKPCKSSSSISSSTSAARSGSRSSMSAPCSRPTKSSMRSAKSAGRNCPSADRGPAVRTCPVPSASEATDAQSTTRSGVGRRRIVPGKTRRKNETKEISTPTNRISRSSGAKYKSAERTTRRPSTSTIW